MIDRIARNEQILNNLLEKTKILEAALDAFQDYQDELEILNKYYGSKSWFKDKKAYETGEISRINAGVLSEDAVWNLNERISDIYLKMENLVNGRKQKQMQKLEKRSKKEN